MNKQVCSLRQHDLDQVIRVERGSLVSVPHRGTPRSIVGLVITLKGSVCQHKNRLVQQFSAFIQQFDWLGKSC